jgi:hypothetical protein
MPFTVSHAVVAPALARLSRGCLPVSALAVGAMAPDFEYLLFLEPRRTIGHTPIGIVLLCLPISLLLLTLWHGTVKRPLARLLPDRWAHLGTALDRPFPVATWGERAGIVAAVLLGAVSHVAWDSFTHAGGAGVARLPQLRSLVPGTGVAGYAALQYGGGVLGMAGLGVAVLLWARRQPRRSVHLPPVRHRALALAAIIAAGTVLAAANVARAVSDGPAGPETLLIAAVLGGMTGVALAALAYASAAGPWSPPSPAGNGDE